MLSAIVPTRDRPDLLRDCLVTLAAQLVEPGELEVVVIDDGSAVDLESVVAEAPAGLVTVRYVRQEPAGLTVARNHGAEVAGGDVLAYLDDDTLVSQGWASAVLAAFDATGCDGLAGRVELKLEGPAPRWLDSGRLRLYLSELDLGAGPRREIEPPLLPVGANCAVRRAAFDRVGGFRSGFGRSGASLLSNEELDFFRRVRATGGTIVYEPEAHVLHRVPESRLTIEWFRRRSHAQGVSDVLLDPPAASARQPAIVARELLRGGRAAPILVQNLLQGHGPTNARLWLSYCRGRLDAVRRAVATSTSPMG